MVVKYAFFVFAAFVSFPDIPHLERPPIKQTCRASYYGEGNWHGTHTAWGEKFEPKKDMTAAHRELPNGFVVMVERANKEKAAWVRINDRGPYVYTTKNGVDKAGDAQYILKEGESWRNCIDLSIRAAKKLDIKEDGMKTVHIRYWRKNALPARRGKPWSEGRIQTGRHR